MNATHRPALFAAVFFGVGIVLSELDPSAAVNGLWASAAALAAAVIGHVKGWRPGVQAALLSVVLVGLGAGRNGMGIGPDGSGPLVSAAASGERVLVRGRVLEEPERVGDAWRAVVGVEELTRADTVWAVSERILVRLAATAPTVRFGDRLRLSIQIRLPQQQRNPGGFDYRAYLARRGIRAMATVRQAKHVIEHQPGAGSWMWSNVVLPVRGSVRAAVDRNLDGAPAGLLRGVLLGERRSVPDPVREAFTRSGVNHVLAVSGLHVGLVGACVLFALRLASVGRRASCLMTAAALVVYALVTGMPPSVLRASGSGCLGLFAAVGNRDGDSLNTLGLAGLSLLVAVPQMLWDPGFQLSFAATGSILLFHRPLGQWMEVVRWTWWRRWAAPALAVSLAAQLGTLPLVATHFGRLSPISLLANLVIVPTMGLAVGLGMLTTLVSQFSITIAAWLNGANWLTLQCAIRCAEVFAAVPWSSVQVASPSPLFIAAYVCALPLLDGGFRASGPGRASALAALVAANAWVWSGLLRDRDVMDVWMLDVGNGDCTFVRFPNGRTMLVDAGARAGRSDAGAYVVLPFLRAHGVRRIDVVIGSHPHNDHIGGLISVLKHVPVGHYLDPGLPNAAAAARRVRDLVREKGIPYAVVTAGDSLTGLGVGALVLHPRGPPGPDDELDSGGVNSHSVVVRLTHLGRSLLLTGDIERDTDPEMLAWGARLDTHVLKAAHHGSGTSSSAAFLAATSPRVVTVSCGAGNRYGHPSPRVIQRLEQVRAHVVRTDRSGAIRIRFLSETVRVSTWLGQ